MLVVDADERVRESLTGLLAIGGRVLVVGGAGHPGVALDLALATHPDVVIVDPRLPDVDTGTAFVGRLRELVPDTRRPGHVVGRPARESHNVWSDTYVAISNSA